MSAPETHHHAREEGLAEMAQLLRRLVSSVDDLRARIEGTTKQLYTISEVARLTGRSAFTVRRWISEGRLVATRVAGTGARGRLLVPSGQLLRLLPQGLGGDLPPTVAGQDGDAGGQTP